jgi:deazaflavin-dependent oxidoreductase (nitroreductase family)
MNNNYNETPYIYVTTIGRKSGNPHEIEIWFVDYEGAYYLVSGGGEAADWVKNIRANPTVTLRVGAQDADPVQALGRPIERAQEPELAAAVAALMEAKYQWSDGLIVELKPVESST